MSAFVRTMPRGASERAARGPLTSVTRVATTAAFREYLPSMNLTRTALALLALTASACEKQGTNSPNLIEQTADDVGGEVDGAGESASEAADDVDESVTSAVGND